MLVTARAYGDQPLRLHMVSRGKAVFYLAIASGGNAVGTRSKTGVGYPKNCVYRFELEKFEALERAYDAGDSKTLAALWAALEPLGEAEFEFAT